MKTVFVLGLSTSRINQLEILRGTSSCEYFKLNKMAYWCQLSGLTLIPAVMVAPLVLTLMRSNNTFTEYVIVV